MKKHLAVSIFGLALMALMIAPVTSFAGPGCGAGKTTATACSAEDKAKCVAAKGISLEDCEKYCQTGKFSSVTMSVKGMTCAGCENGLRASLEKVPGVMKVGTVSHETETAFVFIDPKLVTNDALLKVVTDKGYKAEIAPAVVNASATTVDAKAASCAATCGAAAAAACGKTKKADDSKKADGSK
ncbi:MAG: heavy-metal-associated domain-containing protein [candidate division Zixibacteria bacterium]|nr:heavy-metal-associated domain-containing protein [candidate division Zixibacteria bacterium]